MLLKTTSLLCMLIALLAITASQAEIYKVVDERGNINFTDEPGDNPAEPVKLKPSSIISPPPVIPINNQVSEAEGQRGYNFFTIKQPLEGETIRNADNLKVSTDISPKLKASDSLQLYLNGKPYGKKQKGASFSLANIDRGTHDVSVKVLNEEGKVLNSASVKVHLKQTSKLLPKPNPTPVPPSP
ncbi:DUF4124 domain-containing protein [Endozoicomonas sp. SM1973]|uniref:DUF4124 domain-containing protein n=1 Tax=Spartinivicinus marinus TaxID=2994442 RepID=A0A853I5L1_9GAMM|nr:DUF4124 domain-containing protein [Spartinivicinus marinus]MCX4026510.1 DUF4124 domain-containing protein [Spartinivicinus marinus]NYZ66882.1 DUF4124 domain-containing protein [Spartinivicinus marinus]